MNDDYLEQLRRDVRSHGVFLLHVHEDEEGPGWTYTIGLHDRGHPEVVLFGPDQDSASVMLNDLALRVVAGVERFDTEPVVLEGFLGSPYEVAVLPLPGDAHDEHLGMAQALAGGEVEAVQLVVTGSDHRWPWEYDAPGEEGSSAYVPGPTQDLSGAARRRWTEHVLEVAPGVAYDTRVYLCRRVQTGEQPVLHVVRDRDGSWQMLCGGLHGGRSAGDDGIARGFVGRMVELDPTLGATLDLPFGTEADRTNPDGPWERAPMPRPGLGERLRERFRRRR